MNYNDQVIAFFKKHHLYEEKMFDYFKKHSTMIDYNMEEYRPFVGCYPILSKENIIKRIHVNTPYVNDHKTMLITIHELVHAIDFYHQIGHHYREDLTVEALPILFEKIYVEETNNNELSAYSKWLDEKISKSNDLKYQIALAMRDELYNAYHDNFKDVKKLSKKIVKKYEKTR